MDVRNSKAAFLTSWGRTTQEAKSLAEGAVIANTRWIAIVSLWGEEKTEGKKKQQPTRRQPRHRKQSG